MYYQLNLHLASFGLNATPHITLCPNTEEDVDRVLKGYHPVLVGYELYEFHVDVEGKGIGEKCVTTRILKRKG